MRVFITWMLLTMPVMAEVPDNLLSIEAALEAGEVIAAEGVSVRSGTPPDYGEFKTIALRTRCRVWLELDAGVGAAVFHENCPMELRPTIDDCLRGSTWQKTGTPVLSGVLPLNLSHTRDASYPSGVRPAFRPAALYGVVSSKPPRSLGGAPERCQAEVGVGLRGRAQDIEVSGCSPERAEAFRKALLRWAWDPFVLGGEARPFTTRVAVTF